VRPWAEQRAAILALARRLWSMSPTDARPCFDAMCAHCALQLQRGREMFFLQRRPPVSCRPILPWTLPGARPPTSPVPPPSLRAYARHRRFHHCCRSSRAGRRYLRTLAKASGSRREQRATRQEYPRHGPQAIPGRGVELLAFSGTMYLLFRPPVSAKDFYAFFKGCGGTGTVHGSTGGALLLDTLQDVPRRMPRRMW